MREAPFVYPKGRKATKGAIIVDDPCLGAYQVRAQKIMAHVLKCAECGHNGKRRLEVHHLDNDPTNNARENLQKLCSKCHGRTRKKPTRYCDVDGCCREHYAKGMCQRHYMRGYMDRRAEKYGAPAA